MMRFGVVMLVHTALHRAMQVARYWAEADCPVVMHVDRAVTPKAYQRLVEDLADLECISLMRKHRCEWGTWPIVAATQDASQKILTQNPDIHHVLLTSGTCLPLRPPAELEAYLAEHPRTDFIESATTGTVSWTVGGLEEERFTLRFPFAWRKQRKLFDGYVRLQRALRIKRKLPKGLVPHIGSQWWCLSRQTLSAILEAPDRATHDAYFKRVWIPDESYFQTLARMWSTRIESRSLTLSKFDVQGKPHIFYDDHLSLLKRSDCFVARKIWPHADRLYETFLSMPADRARVAEPDPSRIEAQFAKAAERRKQGRRGLVMQSRFPRDLVRRTHTATRYSVFHGFSDLFPEFEDWLSRASDTRVHGHLFAEGRARFADGARSYAGALSNVAAIRDANPQAFLRNLIWNTRGERQCFQFGARDAQSLVPILQRDPNAEVFVISGAWALKLFQTNANFTDLARRAEELQRIEHAALRKLRAPQCRAKVQMWTLADVVSDPMPKLQGILEDLGTPPRQPLAAVPRMVDLSGFGQFLQNLRNVGLTPHLVGEFVSDPLAHRPVSEARKPYLVKP